jgi:hypothetical protein
MTKAKTATTNDNTENAIQVLKESTCKTSSGKSTLTYQVGVDESNGIQLKVSGNDGGGFWSAEWVSFTDIQAALKEWPEDQGVTSMTFRKVFRGKSANTPGFLIAVLVAEAILEPVPDKKRLHQACDPAAFLASVLGTGKGKATKAKAAPKKKATATKAKTPRKATAKTKEASTRKSPARSKKAS